MFEPVHQEELVDNVGANEHRVGHVDRATPERVGDQRFVERLQAAPGQVHARCLAADLARADAVLVNAPQVADGQHTLGHADKRQLVAHQPLDEHDLNLLQMVMVARQLLRRHTFVDLPLLEEHLPRRDLRVEGDGLHIGWGRAAAEYFVEQLFESGDAEVIGKEHVGVGITHPLQPQLPRLGVFLKVRVTQPFAPLRQERQLAHLALKLVRGHNAVVEKLLAHAIAHAVGQDGKLG